MCCFLPSISFPSPANYLLNLNCFTFLYDPSLSVILSWTGRLRQVITTSDTTWYLVGSSSWIWRVYSPKLRNNPWTALLCENGMCNSVMKKPSRAGGEVVALTYSFSVTKTKYAVWVEQSNDQDLDSDLLKICEKSGSTWFGSIW